MAASSFILRPSTEESKLNMRGGFQSDVDVKRVVRLVMALPFLPRDNLQEGLNFVRMKAGEMYVV